MRPRPVTRFALLAALALLLLSACRSALPGSGQLIELRDGWEYRWGDAPAESASRAAWLLEPVAPGGWRRYPTGSHPVNAERRHVAWYRTRLPSAAGDSPTLYLALQRWPVSFEAWLDGRPVYSSEPSGSGNACPCMSHVIPLPSRALGKQILFRAESPEPEYLESPTKEIVVGPALAVHAKIVRQGFLSFFLGVLFLVIGAYAFFAHWKRCTQPFYLSFSFGLMAISAGGMTLTGSELYQFYLYAGSLGWYLHMAAMLLFPVGLWAYVEQSIGAGWRNYVRRFWQFHLIYAAVTPALDASGWVPFFPTLLQGWFFLILAESVAIAPLLVKSIRSGQRAARLFGVGMAVLSVCGTVDTLSGLELLPVYLELFPWGLAFFIGVLVYIQEDEFVRAQRRLREYSQALEGRTEELRMHRDHLEDLVAERTRDLEQATIAAQAASHAKSEFLAHMSHELRTPLNGILGYAQVLQRESDLPERARKGLEVIQDSGEHLLAMINDVLDLAKVEAGRLELAEEVVRLGGFLHGVADMAEGWARAKGLGFRRLVPADLAAAVRLDGKRLRQILLNLLGNAVKFTAVGSVGLEAERTGDRVRFRVVDSGVGIPEEDLGRLFQPFQQPGNGGHQDGTGLGLAISQKLARMMGGEIRVESTVNGGSTFWLDLDLPEVEPAPTDRPLRLRPVQLRRPLHALVVDDREENRAVLREMLEPLGFTVTEAAGGAAAVASVRSATPGLILLDLMMPGLDGFDTLRQIRELPGGEHIPAVAVSASAFPETRGEARDAGFDGFIPKPVRVAELHELLRDLLPGAWLASEPADRTAAASEPGPLPEPPPATEVAALYELARLGDVGGIEEHVKQLQRDGGYEAFAEQVAALAEGFEIQALQAFLCRWHRPRPSEPSVNTP